LTRALVTGSAGFIGSHVAERCQQLGFEVVAVDDLSGGFLDNIPPRAEFRQGNVSDADFVASLFSEGGFDSSLAGRS
jgi:UDP-glucose 4-epimerase